MAQVPLDVPPVTHAVRLFFTQGGSTFEADLKISTVDFWKIGGDMSGQISSRRHTSFGPPKGSGLEGKSPAISGKSRLVKYFNLARYVYVLRHAVQPEERKKWVNVNFICCIFL